MSFIFEIIKCVHEAILSQCVLDAIRVNMDLTLSVLRSDFYLYRLIARNMPLSEISSLGETFCELPGSMLDKLKRLHSEVFTEVHWGEIILWSNLDWLTRNGNNYSIFSFPLYLRFESSYINETLWKNSFELLPSQQSLVMGCWPSSLSLVLERIFNRIRLVLACCGGQVIV